MTKTKFTDKLFGGVKMSWVKVILFALATAVLTTVFLVVPVFKNTSFREMGVSYEAWILFAVIIMTNCEKPLESALKTFVFFLISQPLIYLFQVPFSYMSWGLFGYYYFWFMLTLLTFPMAFVGWYLKKRNWLSLLILSPVICFLALLGCGYANQAIYVFPNYIISTVFCFAQIIFYLYAFFDDIKQQLVGLAAALIVIVASVLFASAVDIEGNTVLPDEPSFSDSATVSLEDSSYGDVELTDPQGGYVRIHLKKYGSVVMTVKDKDKIYLYKVEAIDDNGIGRIEVNPVTEESTE